MDLLTTKLVAICLLWGATFFFAFLPIFVSKILKRGSSDSPKALVKSTSLLDRLNYVAGGVFLATIFLDLIPEATEKLTKELKERKITMRFHLTSLIMAIGILAFMNLEHVTLLMKDYCVKQRTGGDVISDASTNADEKVGLFSAAQNDPDSELYCMEIGSEVPEENCRVTKGPYGPVSTDDTTGQQQSRDKHLDEKKEIHVETSATDDYSNFTSTTIRSYILVFALSLHSVFDGVVIGLTGNTTSVWWLFSAVIFHKSLVALSLGSRLLKITPYIQKSTTFFLLFMFTLTSPIGGGVGVLMNNGGSGGSIAEGILLAVATGTFMFVTFFEMLKFEGDSKGNFTNGLLVSLGFIVAAVGITIQEAA